MLPEKRVRSSLWEALHGRFYARYEQLSGRGSSYGEARLEIVTLRLRATAATPRPKLSATKRLSAKISPEAANGKRSIYWADLKKAAATPIYDGALLAPGNRIRGPAVIETTDTTVVVHPGRWLRVDAFGNFEINFSKEGEAMPKVSEMKNAVFDGRNMGYVPPKKLSISPKLKLHRKSAKSIDPITYEVIRHSLWHVNEEHGATIQRLSGSPVAMYALDLNPSI